MKQHDNVLVHAVCGAGKTEIVLESIAYALTKGHRIGWIIPRKEVVIELKERIALYFKDHSVVAVYGHHTAYLEADIVLLTAHQAYRYPNAFGLTIVDEVDAFPYVGNALLQGIVERTTKGSFIFLSATPTKDDQTRFSNLCLYQRPHQQPLPVPKIFVGIALMRWIYLWRRLHHYRQQQKPCLVFVPTVEAVTMMVRWLKLRFPDTQGIHSQMQGKETILQTFKQNPQSILVTTTLLERGITLAKVQVIAWNAHHVVFNESTLIQMAGRVGRKAPDLGGDVIWIAPTSTPAMEGSIRQIQKQNQSLVASVANPFALSPR